eukprot:TRINITY_DN1171_c0_g2_i1.p1 TRINITY_DN1171_c0_g2~~TRINITY_DN1171_c0_g2_i1.p1  ORF type:complete len:243 (-),score=72.62 TRINITY_DN1171_c0_g2_i1:162-857(-)
MIRRPPRSTHCISSAASDVYKRQVNAHSQRQQQLIRTHTFNLIMAYSFREHVESKCDITGDGQSNCTPATAVKDTDNPFFEPPPQRDKPAEKEEYKVDVMDLIGKRNNQKILASPDLALSRKGLGKGKRAAAAHRVLGRFASQDVGRFESENLVKAEANVPTDESKSKALQSAANLPITISTESNKPKLPKKEQDAVKESTKPNAEAEIYHSPRTGTPCCGRGMKEGCIIV